MSPFTTGEAGKRMLYTVKQVARMAGISVRALHHYDQIGLLKPASVGENGYRYYGREELLRLQQILFHRELEFPLEAIAAVLDQPGFDRKAALRHHRERLASEVSRYRRLLKTLDVTLAALEGDAEMKDADLYKGFDPKKQAEYEAWIAERYGAETIARSKQAAKGWSKADWEAFLEQGRAFEREMARALTGGLPADSEAVQARIPGLFNWLERAWGRKPEKDAFIGLGGMYMTHPDFRARYETLAPGLAEYLAEAMRLYAEREL